MVDRNHLPLTNIMQKKDIYYENVYKMPKQIVVLNNSNATRTTIKFNEP